jgi:ABC-type amino acid transport system permease subunit
VVAIGTAVGAILASMRMQLEHATKVMPLGIAMGLLVILMKTSRFKNTSLIKSMCLKIYKAIFPRIQPMKT